MTKNFPELRTGDVMRNANGREYIVAKDDDGDITYAYVPVKGDSIVMETRTPQELTWVNEIRRANSPIWTRSPSYRQGDTVYYEGNVWTVDRFDSYTDYLTLTRTVRVPVDKVN